MRDICHKCEMNFTPHLSRFSEQNKLYTCGVLVLQVASYGGKLKFTLQFTVALDSERPNRGADVEIVVCIIRI